MLYGRRKRLEDMSRAEAEGRSFWTDELDEQARAKIFNLVTNLLNKCTSKPLLIARQMTLQELGLIWLSGKKVIDPFDEEIEDIFKSIFKAKKDIIFSLLEAIISLPSTAGSETLYQNISYSEADQLSSYLVYFVKEVRTILQEHRVSFDLIQGRFIPFESRIMHEAVVVPTLTLLGSCKDYANVEKAYLNALDELHRGNPDNAITDASVALQEALTSLGCEGNSLGPLSKSAVNKRIISSHDKKLIDWVSADRSTKGDAHTVNSASAEDAWLTVHVVGAIILRITSGSLRSEAAQ